MGGIVALVAGLLASVLSGVAGPASAVAGFSFSRLAGADRYETAAVVATSAFPSAETAVLVTGENFPDALAASYWSGTRGAPILLVTRDGVPAATAMALRTLRTNNVVIIGQAAAVSDAVQAALSATASTAAGGGNLQVSRIGGSDRYETMRALVAEPGSSNVGLVGGKKTALLASGENFPDALAFGPLAWAQALPVVLTTAGTLEPRALAALRAAGAEQVLIGGGELAVATQVETDLAGAGIAVARRFSGIDRSDTSRQIADYAIDTFEFKKSHVNVATGAVEAGGADALAFGPHGGKEDPTVVLVTNSATDAGQLRQFFIGRAPTLTDAHAGGGETALSSTLLAVLAADAVPGSGGGATTPTVSSISPTSGSTAGGTAFTVSGSGLAAATGVSFCGVAATSVVAAAGGTSVSGITPAGAAGACPVVVSLPASTLSVPGGFTYVAPATTGSIAGTVVLDGTGASVGGLCVDAWVTNRSGLGATTSASGSFAIANLPPGAYRVLFYGCGATRGDYVEEFYQDATFATATLVQVTAGGVATLSASVVRAGKISGTVTADGTGAPLPGMCVSASSANPPVFDSGYATAADGTYTIGGLPGGSYAIQFRDCSPDPYYITERYDNSPPAPLTRVTVTPGSTAGGVSASLELGGRISGTVRKDGTGAPIAGVCVSALRRVTSSTFFAGGAVTAVDGTYRVDGLKPGNYDVVFRSCGITAGDYVDEYFDNVPSQSARSNVVVTAGMTTSGIDASLARAGKIAGRVVAENGGQPLADICVTTSPPPLFRGFFSGYATGTNASGDYVIGGLAAGSYKVEFADCRRNEHVTEFYDDAPTLTAGQAVAVVAGATRTGINAALTRKAPRTNAPDLVSAARLPGNTVEYVFDETLSGGGLQLANFHVYDGAGTQLNPTSVVQSGSARVVAQYTESQLASATVATVERGAVMDLGNLLNPVGDAALALPGRTARPDLLSVSISFNASGNTVIFTFDSPLPAGPVTLGDFHLYDINGFLFTPLTTFGPAPVVPVGGSTTVTFTTGSGGAAFGNAVASAAIVGGVDNTGTATPERSVLITR